MKIRTEQDNQYISVLSFIGLRISIRQYKRKKYFFPMRKNCFVLTIFRFLCFPWICNLQNLWRHNKHYRILENTSFNVSLECYLVSRWNLVKYWYHLRRTFPTLSYFHSEDWGLGKQKKRNTKSQTKIIFTNAKWYLEFNFKIVLKRVLPYLHD